MKSKKTLLFSIFLALFAFVGPLKCAEEQAMPTVHVLMPLYNTHKYVLSSVASVMDQSYPNLTLLIFDDGSTDGSMEAIQAFLEKNPELKKKILIQSRPKNLGVADGRTKLIHWSKSLDPKAYIFWLDSDDQYTDKSFIQDVIKKMQETKADICLFNFSIAYEDKNQKKNSLGLINEKEKMASILRSIASSPHRSITPLQFPHLLEVTSLGWTKAYAPTVAFPRPFNGPFQDFVYMAALLNAEKVTALSPEREPIQYLRRSDSICGKRKSTNFTDDVPNQLKQFFNTVFEQSKHKPGRLQKVMMAEGFVSRKLQQYLRTLEKIIEEKSYLEIDDKTLQIYLKKVNELDDYVHQKIEEVRATKG
jgi:glycosyltransferase involved in cell wall biosynthesis